MQISHLSLTNFRSFARLEAALPEGILLIKGRNAQGKTSILEAVYYLSTFTSFHAQSDRQLINFTLPTSTLAVARLIAQVQADHKPQKLEVRIIRETALPSSGRVRKEILVNDTKRSQQNAIGAFNAVIFLPQMMRILEEGPEERRRYLNLTISPVVPGYARSLADYSKALERRNALLKTLFETHGDPVQLEYWDQQLAEHGSVILSARQRTIRELEGIVSGIHRHLTAGQDILRLHYRPGFDYVLESTQQQALFPSLSAKQQLPGMDEIKSSFLAALHHHHRDDIRRGSTAMGPHRDDLKFLSNGIDLEDYGSRGQIRTALLALKIAEVEWVRQSAHASPVFLLDEVLAELDSERRQQLLDYLPSVEQAILTTTDLNLFPSAFLKKCTIWEIENGQIISNSQDPS